MLHPPIHERIRETDSTRTHICRVQTNNRQTSLFKRRDQVRVLAELVHDHRSHAQPRADTHDLIDDVILRPLLMHPQLIPSHINQIEPVSTTSDNNRHRLPQTCPRIHRNHRRPGDHVRLFNHVGFPHARRKHTLTHGVDPLTQHLGAEHALGIRLHGRQQLALRQTRMPKRRVRLRPTVTIVNRTTRNRRPLEDPQRLVTQSTQVIGSRIRTSQLVRITQRRVRRSPKMLQNNRLTIASIRSRPHLRTRPRQRCVRQRRPRLPRLMLTQLIQNHQIARQATTTTTRRRLHLVVRTRHQLERLLARIQTHDLNLRSQLRHTLRHLNGAPPNVLSDIKILRATHNQRRATIQIHAPQRQHLHDRRLAVLTRHQQQHVLETELPRRNNLERVDQ